jgi:trk system potassium uptake protein TrkA
MRILIGGAGEVGRGLAEVLLNEGKVVALIDNDPDVVREAQSINALVIQGDIKHRKTLEKAGISDSNIFVAVTDSDEQNLIASALARHCIQTHKPDLEEFMAIARVNDPETLLEASEGHLIEWAGIKHVVSTIDDSIKRLQTGLQCKAFEEVLELGNDAYIVELNLTKGATNLAYTTLREARENIGGLPTIVGLQKKDGTSLIPDADTSFVPGDRLAFATIGTGSFLRIVRLTGNEEPEFPSNPRVLIFGANLLGTRLISTYLENGCRVTVIEEDLELANKLAGSEIGNNRLLDIINGEHRDIDLLKDIDVQTHNIALAALDDDHASIAAVLLAQDMGVERTGLILNDAKLVNVVHRMGISYAVARRKVAIDAILTKIHSYLPGAYNMLESIPNVVGMSVPLTEGHKFVGKTLDQCKFTKGCKVVFIQRTLENKKTMTLSAESNKQLLANDRLIVFMPTERVSSFEKSMGV